MEGPGTPSPLSRFGIFLLLGGLAVVLALLWIARQLPPPKPAHKGAPGKQVHGPGQSSTVVQGPTAQELGRSIAAALAVLNDPNNRNKAQALAALRAALSGAAPKVAIAAIRQFLKTGQDAKTGLRFKVGDGGVLDQAPSLRTFLMDALGTLSQEAQTSDGAEVARETLSAMTSADEWAVAMRNVAWSDPDGSKAYLADKFREMLNYAPWQQNPSVGYLEAFDIAPYSGDATLTSDLAALAKTPSPVRTAALIALERLSALAPAQVTSYLNANPVLLSDLPLLRADYMGNVNLSDPAQEAQAETYLARPDVTEAEKEKFLGRLATPAGFVSNTLLTPADTSPSLVEHQEVVNRAALGWLASGSYPTLTASLQSLVQRTAPRSGGG